MSGPAGPEILDKIGVFRRVRARSFASVHGVSVVNLWSVLGRCGQPRFTRCRERGIFGDPDKVRRPGAALAVRRYDTSRARKVHFAAPGGLLEFIDDPPSG